MDMRIEITPLEAAAPVACRKGCSYCCHAVIGVHAHEVAALAEAIHGIEDTPLRQVIVQAIHRNAARTNAARAHPGRRFAPRCALLGDDDACLVYAHRPARCQGHQSHSLEACMTDYVSAEAPLLGGEAAPEGPYELSTALSEFLTDEYGCRARLAAGKPAFRHALATTKAG
jgi:Fe-S-cluster containining protein